MSNDTTTTTRRGRKPLSPLEVKRREYDAVLDEIAETQATLASQIQSAKDLERTLAAMEADRKAMLAEQRTAIVRDAAKP
jgi:hypothetical protein